MIETILREGNSPGWLPTNEAGRNGDGGLCQIGIVPSRYYGAKYLPFAKNGINWIEQGPMQDVISYNFTGCLMAAFTQNGVRKVCHVSTGPGQDCLAAWAKVKKESTNVLEFRPSDYIDTKGGAFNGCYGVITGAGRMFAITVVRDVNGLKVASIKEAVG